MPYITNCDAGTGFGPECFRTYVPPKPKAPKLTYRTPQQSYTTMDTSIQMSKFQNISPLHF